MSTSLSESCLEAPGQVLVYCVCKNLFTYKIFKCFLFKIIFVYLRLQLLELTCSCYVNSDDVLSYLLSGSVDRVHLRYSTCTYRECKQKVLKVLPSDKHPTKYYEGILYVYKRA